MAEEYSEEELYDMSDEELEKAFKEAKATVEEDSGSEQDDMEPQTDDESEQDTDEDESNEQDELDDELEQPEEDSDDDDSLDDDEEENDSDESEDAEEEGEIDAPKTEDDTKSEDKKETETDDKQSVQKRKFKADGLEYEFTDEEIMSQFPKVFGQAMDYTKKMQRIKPWRKTIDAIETAGLQHDDINLAIDVLKGNKLAIKSLLEKHKIDAMELEEDTETQYKPNDYGRDDTELAIKDIVDELSVDREFDKTQAVISKEWDDGSRDEFRRNPEAIKKLHIDIKSGVYDKVQAVAEKLRVYDNGRKTNLEYYKDAAMVLHQEQQKEAQMAQKVQEDTMQKERLAKVKEQDTKRANVKKASKKRKSAATTNKSVGANKKMNYLDDSDEAFEEWYKQLEEMH